jgi:glycosyltransferase involved in cell wall biosynthesis
MKIAQVCLGYYPYIGGVETVVKETSERLVQKGFEVEILTQDPLGQQPAIEIINGIKIRRFRTTGTLGWDFPFSHDSLRSFLKENENRYDLIHAHRYAGFAAIYAAEAKRKSKLVFNSYYHGGKGRTWLMSLLHIPYRPIGKTIFENADKVICVSETEKLAVQRHFRVPDEKLVVIPGGVNVDEIARSTPFPSSGKLLLYVGRLEKYKNIHLAIQSMAHLPGEYRLIIIGNGPYKGKLLQLLERLHISDRVQILSGLSNEEVYRWYRTCDLVLNLSSQESFGQTVIEGLAAGKPVIVNNQMALAEWPTKFGQVYSVEARTLPAEKLAEQINRACNSKVETPELSQYSWDSIAEQIKKLYESL